MESNSSVDDDNFFRSLPPGYRFCPTEVELISMYLMPKIQGRELPPNRIHDIFFYEFGPDHLAEKYVPCKNNEWYFFTWRNKKYKGGQRPDRAAGAGYWKATGADRPIYHHDDEVIGYRKILVYYHGKPTKGVKSCWVMHEYKAKNPPPNMKKSSDNMRLDSLVLCKIYKKGPKLSLKKSRKDNMTDNSVKEGNNSQSAGMNHNILINQEGLINMHCLTGISGSLEDNSQVTGMNNNVLNQEGLINMHCSTWINGYIAQAEGTNHYMENLHGPDFLVDIHELQDDNVHDAVIMNNNINNYEDQSNTAYPTTGASPEKNTQSTGVSNIAENYQGPINTDGGLFGINEDMAYFTSSYSPLGSFPFVGNNTMPTLSPPGNYYCYQSGSS